MRVGDSLVAFPVWAFASGATPGSTVRVVFPEGYTVNVAAGDMPAPTTAADGTVVLETGSLKTPLTFFAYLVADRAGDDDRPRGRRRRVGGSPVPLTISAWADDAAWGERVGDLAARALPVLSEQIGLGWPRTGGLDIHESVGRASGGYAGLFDPAAGRIDVAYDARDEVVLHEAAHAWFDGSLLADRWATEGFASYYARVVAPDLGVTTSPDAEVDTIPADLEAARIPLNAWGAAGQRAAADRGLRVRGVARTRPGDRGAGRRRRPEGGLGGCRVPDRGVPAAGTGRLPAHPRPSTARPTGAACSTCSTSTRPRRSTTCGGRGSRGRRTSPCSMRDRPHASPLRTRSLASAGDWQLPRQVRDAMRAWRFDDAERLLTEAETILAQRTAIATDAAAAGLTAPGHAPDRVRKPGRLRDRDRPRLDAEREAIPGYTTAVAARPTTTDLVSDIGLWGTSPEADLEAAETQFASGRPGRRDDLGRARGVGLDERRRHRPRAAGQRRAPGPRGAARRPPPRRRLVPQPPPSATWHDERGRRRRLSPTRSRGKERTR